MTTKEQERKALAQIRKIVDGLGEGSYIGTAFEGCFEIADSNIENDFGWSMQQRAESAEKKAAAWLERAAELEKANRELQKKLAEEEKRSAWCAEEMNKFKRRMIYPSLYAAITEHYKERIEICQGNMAQAAEIMVDADPRDIAFSSAVNQYKKHRAELETAKQVISELDRLCVSCDEQ